MQRNRKSFDMMCPKCGKKMARTEKSPTVFIPEKVPDTLDALQVSKVWVCDSNHSDYLFYLLEDENNLHVTGIGAEDLIHNVVSADPHASVSNPEKGNISLLIPILTKK